jgi:membrane protease YdiL (CAAX protease family)
MSDVAPAAAAVLPPVTPSRILPANLLFLITLLLGGILGSLLTFWLRWPGMILNELFLILLPAWLFARRTGSATEALRMRWVGMRPCALGFVSGVSILPLAAAAALLGKLVLRYDYDPGDLFRPVGFAASTWLVAGMALAAPFCEEMVFRGYILHACEHAGWRPRTSVLFVAGLFTAWHVSPARAPAVAVAALTVTYIAWKTGSVWPSVAAHMGCNSTAAVLNLMRSRFVSDDPNTHVLLAIGIPATALAALCLWRIGPGRPRAAAPFEGRTRGAWWPLWAAGTIIAVLAVAEVVVYRWHRNSRPEPVMVRVKAPWTTPLRLEYEIYGKSGLVGTAEYRITPGEETIGFEAMLDLLGPNELTGEAAKVQLEGTWHRESMVLRRFSGHVDGPGRGDRFDYTESGAPMAAPGFSRWFYSPAELPWRLSAARTLEERTGEPVTVKLHEAALRGRAADETREIRVQGETREETIGTPAGKFRTVRIAMGERSERLVRRGPATYAGAIPNSEYPLDAHGAVGAGHPERIRKPDARPVSKRPPYHHAIDRLPGPAHTRIDIRGIDNQWESGKPKMRPRIFCRARWKCSS